MRSCLFLHFFAFFLNIPASAASNAILLTGYWPPTNEMLREFRRDSENPQAWLGKNWRGLGYDVHAYFPEFPPGSGEEGRGDFRVDFTATFNDFMRITRELRPVAILSFGRGAGPWEIEAVYPAHFAEWFRAGRLPSKFGEAIRHEIPNSLKLPVAYRSTLPMHKIARAVNALPSGPRAWVEFVEGPGDFLCGFLGYLGAWRQAQYPHETAMSGFIHVGEEVTKEQAFLALEATLLSMILSLNTESL